MPGDEEKSQHEIQKFCEFVTRSELSINPCSVEKRPPNEPDILCWVNEEGFVAFELVSISDETLERAKNELPRQDATESPFMRLGDPTRRILIKKRSKKYKTAHPIELLVYLGLTVTAFDQVRSQIKQIYYRRGTYRRVWLMGWEEDPCECVIDWLTPLDSA